MKPLDSNVGSSPLSSRSRFNARRLASAGRAWLAVCLIIAPLSLYAAEMPASSSLQGSNDISQASAPTTAKAPSISLENQESRSVNCAKPIRASSGLHRNAQGADSFASEEVGGLMLGLLAAMMVAQQHQIAMTNDAERVSSSGLPAKM